MTVCEHCGGNKETCDCNHHEGNRPCPFKGCGSTCCWTCSKRVTCHDRLKPSSEMPTETIFGECNSGICWWF